MGGRYFGQVGFSGYLQQYGHVARHVNIEDGGRFVEETPYSNSCYHREYTPHPASVQHLL